MPVFTMRVELSLLSGKGKGLSLRYFLWGRLFLSIHGIIGGRIIPGILKVRIIPVLSEGRIIPSIIEGRITLEYLKVGLSLLLESRIITAT